MDEYGENQTFSVLNLYDYTKFVWIIDLPLVIWYNNYRIELIEKWLSIFYSERLKDFRSLWSKDLSLIVKGFF